MAFDLSELLKPVAVRTRFLGRVEVDARTRDFYDWFRTCRRQSGREDPRAFVRSLLREKVSKVGGGPLPPETIEALTDRQLDAFAKAFIKAAGRVLSPHMVRDKRTKRWRTARTGEEYPIARQPDENESARLLRLLTDRDEQSRALVEQSHAEMKRMLEGPTDLLRQFDPIGSQITKLQKEFIGSSLGELAAAEARRSRLDMQTRSYAEEISRAIDRGILGQSFRTSAIRQYGMIASMLADQESELRRARAAIGLTIGASGAADKFLREEMANRKAWAENVQRLLQPNFSSGLLASAMGLATGRSAAVIEAAAGLSRGFMTAANLGLAGAAARGAVAEVLSQYQSDPDQHSSLFRDIVGGIHLADTHETWNEELAGGIVKAANNMRRIDLRDPVQVQLLLALLTLLFMVYVEVAGSSATRADVQDVKAEVRALRESQEIDRTQQRAEWREIRSVVDITPLRTGPDARAAKILSVYPDQLLRVRETRGAWARVEVVPYGTGVAEVGWISRRRLRVPDRP